MPRPRPRGSQGGASVDDGEGNASNRLRVELGQGGSASESKQEQAEGSMTTARRRGPGADRGTGRVARPPRLRACSSLRAQRRVSARGDDTRARDSRLASVLDPAPDRLSTALVPLEPRPSRARCLARRPSIFRS